MNQRGRKSIASLAVVGGAVGVARLSPPVTLTDAQQAVWLEIVNAKPADWFGRDQIGMLEALCRHTVYAGMLAGELDKVQPGWLGDKEGLDRHRELLTMHEKETRAASSLATRLRLTNQAVYDKKVAGRAADRFQGHKRPWQIEAES